MSSVAADARAYAASAGRWLGTLLAAVVLGVLAGRGVSEQFLPREVTLFVVVGAGLVLVSKIAFEVGRGYERARSG